MTVRKNARGHWFVDIVWTNPDGTTTRVRKKSPHQTKRATEQYEREVRAELAAGQYGRRDVPTLKEAMDDYLELVATQRCGETSLQLYRRNVDKHVLPALGRLTVDRITPRVIARFRANLARELAPKTVNTILVPLRSCLNNCVDWGDIATAPKIAPLRVVLADVKVLTEAETALLMGELGEPWRTAVLVALRTGLRIGELLALKWADIDGSRLKVRRRVYRKVIGTPKGGKSRVVPLTNEAAHALEQHPRTLRSEWVFNSPRGGLYTYEAARKALREAGARVDLVGIGWHTMRHTCAAILTSRCGNLRVVQRILGHSKITTTMRYAHLLPGTIDNVDVLDGYGTWAATREVEEREVK